MHLERNSEVLVAEDSRTQAEEIRYFLEEHGYRVSLAANGREALVMMEDKKPAIVVSDILMPEMDGYELCRRMKKEEHLKAIPCILLTSVSDPKEVIRALECGANNFVSKSSYKKYLLSRIDHLLVDPAHERAGDEGGPLEVMFADEKYAILSGRRQILDFLLFTYEYSIDQNAELVEAKRNLAHLNDHLENIVRARTAALDEEIMERKRAEQALAETNRGLVDLMAELEKKAEEVRAVSQQLWQATKLATMGELAASIAHELNNPLATVTLRAESLLTQIPPGHPGHRDLHIIEREVERMANLVANLLQFSRRSLKRVTTLDVHEEIEKTLELIYYHLRNHNIIVNKSFTPGTSMIDADQQQIRQLLLNLFTNASDAMPAGGTLTVRTYTEKNASPTGHRGGVSVGIEIIDTGEGIPPEILPKVMEPFFTTKPEGKGTGLGLAICKRIVEEHKGKIDISSVDIGPGGTAVRILFEGSANL